MLRLNWFFRRLLWRLWRRPSDVINITVTRSMVSGGYDWHMSHVGGASDVVCMANDLQAAVERIVHPPAPATNGIRAYDRDLNHMLHKISYGAHFVLEYDGAAFREDGRYGEWYAQFYDGFRVESSTIWDALEKAWNVLPAKPSPFCDRGDFSPSGGQIKE